MPSPRTSLAGTQVGLSRASGARVDQVGVLGVGRVQPGEAGQGADLAQPLGLDDVGEELRPARPARRRGRGGA